MPYVFEDRDYKVLLEVIDDLVKRVKPMTMLDQTLLSASLLFAVDKAEKVHKPHDVDLDVSRTQTVMVDANAAFSSLLDYLSNEVGTIVMSKVNGVPWFFADELAPELCGIIPTFLDVDDTRSMKEQIAEKYIGGWNKFEGFKIKEKSWTIGYPGDPDMQPVAGAALHGEVLAIYPHAWVMIVDSEINSLEIARLD